MKTILIVAQAAAQRDLLARWLRDDYRVLTAGDGAAGLELVQRVEPDLIFMALALPDSDAGEATRRFAAQARRWDIPMIALPSPATSGDSAAARAAECVDTLQTPLEEEHVYAMLRKWLGGG